MDGDHDIDRCYEVSQAAVLNKTFQELRIQRVALEGNGAETQHGLLRGKKSSKQASVEEVAEKTVSAIEELRSPRRSRHCLPVRRAIRRRKPPRILTP